MHYEKGFHFEKNPNTENLSDSSNTEQLNGQKILNQQSKQGIIIQVSLWMISELTYEIVWESIDSTENL